MTDRILEIVRFRLADGADRAAFLAAAQATDTFLKSCEGYQGRALAEGEDGEWTDVVEWQSMSHSSAAMSAFESDPSAGAFMQHVDPASIHMSHLSREI